jgi:hypothetical protein
MNKDTIDTQSNGMAGDPAKMPLEIGCETPPTKGSSPEAPHQKQETVEDRDSSALKA